MDFNKGKIVMDGGDSNALDHSGAQDRRETLLQRRERVLGARPLRFVEGVQKFATNKSREKRRGQVLHAQRAHRQRTLDYITELENELFRLRESEVALTSTIKAKEDLLQKQSELDNQISPASPINLQVLIQCLNGQIAPGLFLISQAPLDIRNSQQVDLIPNVQSTPPFLNGQWIVPKESIQPSLEIFDPLTEMLFLNFSENIAPTMVPTDGSTNGYRTLLLPLAYDDELVRLAVLATSANHLRFRRRTLSTMAMNYQAAAISRLTRTSASSKGNNPTILATIISLLVNGMMNGGADFQILLDMAKSWINAMDENETMRKSPRSSLDDFLSDQVNLMELYAKPLLQEQVMIRSHITICNPFENPSSLSTMHDIFSSLESAIKQACAIYSYHVSNDGPPDKIEDILEALRITVLGIPNYTPGENALAWVYFIAAAESLSPMRRMFFAKRLMGIYERGTFSDVTTSFNILHQIWNSQVTGDSWTKALMQMPLVLR